MSNLNRRSIVLAGMSGATLSVLSPLVGSQPARAPREAPMTLGVAIDRSGRQRMLSQRMAKAFAQLVNKTLPDRSRRVLNESVASFSTALGDLTRFAAGTTAADSMADQSAMWPRLQRALEVAPSLPALREVMAASDAVLATAEAATGAFERQSTQPAPRIVNLSGRQRMLSQRLAKHFAFDIADGAIPTQDPVIATARTQFISAMAQLKAFPQNTAETTALLTIAESQWAFFDLGLSTKLDGTTNSATQIENVAKSSENILETMDRCTALYARIASA